MYLDKTIHALGDYIVTRVSLKNVYENVRGESSHRAMQSYRIKNKGPR